LHGKRTLSFFGQASAGPDVTETGQAEPRLARTGERFRTVGLAVGAVTFVAHLLLFQPGSPWFDLAWAIVAGSAVIGTVPGYLELDPKAGVAGASGPGLALALRSEILRFHYGCFDRPSGAGVCIDPPAGLFRRTLLPLVLSVGFVLASVGVGYAVGAGVRRARDGLRH
jgi:hypothetical protein